MTRKAPGKSRRKGIGLGKSMELFPTEDAAREWLESEIRPGGPHCPHCGSCNVRSGIRHRSMTHRCRDCPNRPQFGMKTGNVMQGTKPGCRDRAIAIHLLTTNLEGVSGMKLHRDLEITRKSAWHLLHRLRAASDAGEMHRFSGPVEADETCICGLEKNRHEGRKPDAGRGGVGKAVVAGVKDRETGKVAAKVVPDTRAKTLQGFAEGRTEPEARVCTDDGGGCVGMERRHEGVDHSAGECVRGMAHADGIESFRATPERSQKGTFHKFSKKHPNRCARELAGRHDDRDADTVDRMAGVVSGMVGKRLRHRDLKAGNGLAGGARS